jgi:glyoxalase family protein
MKGLSGSGSVHHIAFSTPDGKTQEEARKRILQRMLNPTPVLDRNYFTSIYFREPGGVLFEIATEGPGFAIDEDPALLGQALKLPEQYEQYRKQLEQVLPPVSVDPDKYR